MEGRRTWWKTHHLLAQHTLNAPTLTQLQPHALALSEIATKREICRQKHFSGVFIRRSDQSWATARALRASKKSIRDSVEQLREKHLQLSGHQRRIVRMYEHASTNRLRKMIFPELVDLELRALSATTVLNCPKCCKRLLSRFAKQHVLLCSHHLVGASRPLPFSAWRGKDVVKLCHICGRQVLLTKIDNHMNVCTEMTKLHLHQRRDQEKRTKRKIGVQPPHPPQHLRLGKVTETTIELHWSPPVFSGGASIIDYEIFFSKRVV